MPIVIKTITRKDVGEWLVNLLYSNDSDVIDHHDFDQIIQHFISEVYLIHTSGIVKFARSFGNKHHFESQLIGSFVTAIESFMEITSKKLNNDNINLTDIGTSGSRWFMKKHSSVLLVAIVPNDSKFLKIPNGFELIGEICSELMTNFAYLHQKNLDRDDFTVPEDFEQDVTLSIVEKIQSYDLY